LFCARFGVDALLAASPANISNFGLTVSGLTVSPASLPRLDEVGIASRSGWVIVFTFVLALLTGVICGLVPALQCSKPDLQHALKEGAAVSGAGFGLWSRQRTRSLLVIAEIALALVLLIGAGLLVRSFWSLQQVKPGFQPERLLTLQLEFPWYSDLIRRGAERKSGDDPWSAERRRDFEPSAHQSRGLQIFLHRRASQYCPEL
jgi:hypothetical protein